MGRFLTFLRKIVGGTVSPPPLLRKSFYRTVARLAMAAGVAMAGAVDASCALTFQPPNHSFIQLFEMQQPDLAPVAWEA
jgi:hypothetical protein